MRAASYHGSSDPTPAGIEGLAAPMDPEPRQCRRARLRPRSRFIPYGWRTARGGVKAVRGDRAPLVKHPEEQRALRRMIRLREKGEGPQSIATRLNAAGLRTRVGKPWNRHGVWKILERHENREEARAEAG